LLFLVHFTQAQTFTVVYSFTGGSDGGDSTAGLVNVFGNFFGTTTEGGAYGYGVVFGITPTGQERVVYNFTGGADGATPESGLLSFDGYLLGTTSAGGAFGAGTVFAITPQRKEVVLHSFTGGADGSGPQGGLIMDASGNLYGTTFSGGASGNGTVFELIRPKSKTGAWTEQVLYTFGTGKDGANPVAGVTFDKAGNLYGTTSAGGAYSYGTVFQLTHSSSGWRENVLYQFQLQNDGGTPWAGLIVDASGNLYGATTQGGWGEDGGGTVFKVSPSGSGWSFEVIDVLSGWGISGTERNLLLEKGSIFATTHCDGADVAGTVYELSPSGSSWTYTQLYSFTGGTDGLYSVSTPMFDKQGNLWGTTRYGGANGWGVVFKIKL
jgi:uncharacterized repeat protein (TIGR03803 family)